MKAPKVEFEFKINVGAIIQTLVGAVIIWFCTSTLGAFSDMRNDIKNLSESVITLNSKMGAAFEGLKQSTENYKDHENRIRVIEKLIFRHGKIENSSYKKVSNEYPFPFLCFEPSFRDTPEQKFLAKFKRSKITSI